MKCNLCPRNCNVDREITKGYCQSGNNIRIARSSLHMWEEPCISGDEGSGTIFFTGCNLRCVYCQNRKISRGSVGRILTVSELADLMIELQSKGANNINLVTAGHFIEKVTDSIKEAKERGLNIPIVYNTSSYESIDVIKKLKDYVDIYLPDFKYYNNELSQKYSFVDDYREVALSAIDEMVAQQSKAVFDEREIMLKGVIVRHLILPGQIEDSKKIIELLHDRYGDKIYISIMNQYTPLDIVKDYPELNRRVTEAEYDQVVDYAISLGVEKGFIQEGETATESFIPDFEC